MDLAQLVTAALAATAPDPSAADELRSFRDTVARLLAPGYEAPGYDPVPVEPDRLRSRLDGLPAAEQRKLAADARVLLARADPAGAAAGHYDLTAALPVAAGSTGVVDDPVRRLAPSATAEATGEPGPAMAGRGAEDTDRAALALSAGSPGHTAAMVDVLRRMAAEAERRLGPQHPQTLTARFDLAHGYRSAGRTAEAVEEMRSVVAARQLVLGDDHRDTDAARRALRHWTDG